MGRNVADATNAWWIRRTRGDITRFFRFVDVGCAAAVPDFLAGACGLAVVVDGLEDFGFAVCGVVVFSALEAFGSVCWSGGFLIAKLEFRRGCANALGVVPFRSPHATHSASTHQHLETNRTTLVIFPQQRGIRTCQKMIELLSIASSGA